MALARIINTEHGQMVELPPGYRFVGDHVCVQRVGGTLVLVHPDDAWRMFQQACGSADADFQRPPQSASTARKSD